MKKIAAVIVMLALAAIADSRLGTRQALLGETVSAKQSAEKVRVGLLVPLTGRMSEEGRSVKRGFDLAARSLGVEVDYGDTRCEFETARQAALGLADDGVRVTVGGLCEGDARALVGTAEGDGGLAVLLDAGEFALPEGSVAVRSAGSDGSFADYFVSAYVKAYGSYPDRLSALAYDALSMLVEMESSMRGSYREEAYALTSRSRFGVSGPVEFFQVPVVPK